MATYQLISSVTVGSGGASSIDFTSIPATYTDLNLIVSARASTANNTALQIYFNNSTGSYDLKRLTGDGATAFSDGLTANTYLRAIGTDQANFTASSFGNVSIYIPNYTSSTNKSVSIDGVTETNATTAYASLLAGIRNNTAAINQITIIPDSGNFAQYSTAYLYGIKNS